MKHIINKKGFGLAETTIALFIITLAITSALVLSARVFRIFTTSKAEITASSYAIDGIEMARQIRDSNWIYFGDAQARQKWGAFKKDGGSEYQNGYYTLSICEDQDPDTGDCQSNTLNQFDSFLIYLGSTKPEITDNRTLLYENPETFDLFGNQATLINQYIDGQVPATAQKTPLEFHRYIKLTYLDNTYSPIPDGKESTANAVKVESNVQWRADTIGVQEIKLETILTDWYKRKDHLDLPETL